MNEIISKYGLWLLLGVIVLLALASRRGGGAVYGPDNTSVTQGVDSQYEALKAQTELEKEKIAGEQFANLLDYDTARQKLATDVQLADIEGRYTLAGTRAETAAQNYAVDAAARVAQTQELAQNFRAGLENDTYRYASHEQASAQKQSAWLDFFGGLGHSLLGFL